MPREANFYQDGDRLDYVNGSGAKIEAGEVVPMISRIGVALVDITDGEKGAVKTEGVFEIAAATGVAFAVGDNLYWDDTNSNLTNVATDNIPAGFAAYEKASAEAVAYVKIG